MMQVQGTPKLLIYEMKETLTNGRKKQGHNKSRSQIKNVVVRAIIKYNERNKMTYDSCSLQSRQIIAIIIILSIILNADL